MWPSFANHPEALRLLDLATARPMDYLPRLMLSDWLEERGEGQVAETIRSSIEWVDRRPFPDEICERWGPLNGCYNGWLEIFGYTSNRFIRYPWVNAIVMFNAGGDCLDKLANLPHLTRVKSFPVSDDDLSHFDSMTRLTDLSLPRSLITDTGLARIARITTLTRLSLNGRGFTDAGIDHLRQLKNLRFLSLLGTYITADGLSQLDEMVDLKIETDIRHRP